MSAGVTIGKPDWEVYCEKIADMIVSKQSPEQVHAVRGKLYELLAHCIPPTTILKVRIATRLPSPILPHSYELDDRIPRRGSRR